VSETEAAQGQLAGDQPYAVPQRRRASEGTHLVNGVRAKVDAWRANGYTGASPTTRRLFGYWFEDEHRTADGFPFRFYFCQREAVETFAYLTEIEKVSSFVDLLQFASQGVVVDPSEPRRPRLCFKMATGSGKTLVMSLCITWSYFHALHEPASAMATKFLVIAPNIIVFERLKTDFGDAAVWRTAPMVPPEWIDEFEMTVVLQDDLVPITTRGALFLTNEHRLRDALVDEEVDADIGNPVQAMLGRKVNRDIDAASNGARELFDRISESGRVLVINDEAHHVWSEKRRWNQAIQRLHEELVERGDSEGAGVVSQLDFSATPKYQNGQLFRHVVVDYPLAQAVRDGIVKTPLIGEVRGAVVQPGETAVQRYRQWLDVAVARWQKFDEALSPAGKQPVLFVMCENTQAADEVGDYLRQRPEFSGDRLLVIHTNNQGEITKVDLDLARRVAREIDGPDSKIRCIVSVLMLREGWDVRNVCVITTLRSLTAKAKILPEQTLGRGLRRMTPPGSGYDERVVVIEHDAFKDLWSVELDGGLIVEKDDVETIDAGAIAIFVDEAKLKYDIPIPQLTRAIARSETRFDKLALDQFAEVSPRLAVPDVAPDEYIEYRGIHLVDKVEVERDRFLVPYPEDPSGVISWYTNAALKAGGVYGIAGAFAAVVPLVRDYLRQRVFETEVELNDKVILRRLAENDAQASVISSFQSTLRSLSIEVREATITERAFRVSETPAFPWSRETYEGTRTVFNLTPVDSTLEKRFARFLDRADDVSAWAKLTMNSRFALEYISSAGALRYYYPDFVLRLVDGTHMVIETKGLEDLDVAHKDSRARRWCRDATELAGADWSYAKVPQAKFDAYTGATVEALRRFLAAGGGAAEQLA
jgi:type III restriction enzyme